MEKVISFKMIFSVKLFFVFSVLLSTSAARIILDKGLKDVEILDEEYFKVQPRIFEDKILEAFSKLKEFLQKGDPPHGIPPLDPLLLDDRTFDFYLEDTELKGYLRDATFANFSHFQVTEVEFKLLPLHFKLDIFLNHLDINGRYKVAGTLLGEIALNGTGKFVSKIENLSLSLFVRPTHVNSTFQIKDIIFEFNTFNVQFNYTNEYENDKTQTMNERLVLYILDQVQEKYIPPLVNMLKQILNHFLLGYTFQQIMDIIFQFLSKKV